MTTETTEPKATKVSKLAPTRLQEDGYHRTCWVATVEAGTTMDDLLRPSFWTNLCGPGNRLRRMDRISILIDDESFYAELLVLAVGVGFAKMAKLLQVDIDTAGTAQDAEELPVFAKWGGPHLKWTVVRKSDRERIKDQLESREIAEQWARDHSRAMAA